MRDDLKPLYEGVRHFNEKARTLRREVQAFLSASVTFENEVTYESKVPQDATNAREPYVRHAMGHHILPGLPRPSPIFRAGTIWATLNAEIPTGFAHDAGSIINGLRVQLDYLANVLGRRNGANSDESSWPIVRPGTDLNAKRRAQVNDQIRQLSPEDQAKVWAIQPFETGPKFTADLHASDILRKHKRPLGVVASAGYGPRGSGFTGFLLGDDTSPLTKPGERHSIASYGDMTAQVGFGSKIVIVDPPMLPDWDLFRFIQGAAHGVEEIIRRFE